MSEQPDLPEHTDPDQVEPFPGDDETDQVQDDDSDVMPDEPDQDFS